MRRRKLRGDPRALGRWGERRCERFLRGKGLRTLARNFTCPAGEIDLVMVDRDSSIVFVEVRTRASETFASAEQSVTYSKKSRLSRAVRTFLAAHEIEDRPCRIDVVTIVLPPKGSPRITHYPNAFAP